MNGIIGYVPLVNPEEGARELTLYEIGSRCGSIRWRVSQVLLKGEPFPIEACEELGRLQCMVARIEKTIRHEELYKATEMAKKIECIINLRKEDLQAEAEQIEADMKKADRKMKMGVLCACLCCSGVLATVITLLALPEREISG